MKYFSRSQDIRAKKDEDSVKVLEVNASVSCQNLPIINLSTGFECPLNIKIVEVLFEFRHIQKAYFACSSWIGKK